jgi:hypothetical protein
MFAFDFTPGQTTGSPGRWPEESLVRPNPSSPTLVLGIHPRCTCSRATIEELSAILRQCPKLATRILLYRARAWRDEDIQGIVDDLSQTTVISDLDGLEASRFGLLTSGEALLYDRSGKLLFKGGITGSRGHAGENAGRIAVITLVNGQSGTLNRTPAFGCSLLGLRKDVTR